MDSALTEADERIVAAAGGCWGIDPGLDGGVAFVEGGELRLCEPSPVSGKKGGHREHNLVELFKRLDLNTRPICMEVALGFKGSLAARSMGRYYGLIEAYALLRGRQLNMVRVHQWQKAMLTSTKRGGTLTSKDRSIAEFRRLWPRDEYSTGRPNDGPIEAALMALYGERMLSGAASAASSGGASVVDSTF